MGKHALFETGIHRPGSKEDGFFCRYPGIGEAVRGAGAAEDRGPEGVTGLGGPHSEEDRSPRCRRWATTLRGGPSTVTARSTGSARSGRSSTASGTSPSGSPRYGA
ncbi:MAG: hypothetical protein AVDCRST_MAG55-3372 [uncultured Rubrobacteraceae bacterium]|uniref:Uncharacterized protein n=1 Tax=uncultured Rubrobacteraceae bacterium TaxID=349277 RepID=A0A6J4QDU3_9ACTN|nr:MAG: hypothetical protein AVDCRST_MAG55-3372 [uncultured Rubrobacteraceae bacterium]